MAIASPTRSRSSASFAGIRSTPASAEAIWVIHTKAVATPSSRMIGWATAVRRNQPRGTGSVAGSAVAGVRGGVLMGSNFVAVAMSSSSAGKANRRTPNAPRGVGLRADAQAGQVWKRFPMRSPRVTLGEGPARPGSARFRGPVLDAVGAALLWSVMAVDLADRPLAPGQSASTAGRLPAGGRDLRPVRRPPAVPGGRRSSSRTWPWSPMRSGGSARSRGTPPSLWCSGSACMWVAAGPLWSIWRGWSD